MRAGKLDKLLTIQTATTVHDGREKVETWKELADYVVGTDTGDYVCILAHTSAASNKPITGADYATYWEAIGTSIGAVWAADTAYSGGRVWGDIVPLEGSERFEAQQKQSSVTHMINVRYRADIKTDMRFKYGSRIFEIESVLLDSRERDWKLNIECVERTDDDD